MDVQTSAARFDAAVSTLPPAIRSVLLGIPDRVKATTTEVRLRVDKPIALTGTGGGWFVDRSSRLHNIPRQCFTVTAADLAQAVVSMCSYSVHSHQQEFLGGYISLPGGHRAGICGTAVTAGDRITAVREITSVNLRIAREMHGVAATLVEQLFRQGLCGLLIVGPPASGKTTILRDLARQLASGEAGRFVRVAVVDERGEIGAVHQGIPQNDLGYTCDLLTGYPKGEGILTAVRTLSPQLILCDEIGSEAEVQGVLGGLSCGVKVVATAHAASVDELLRRRQIVKLLEGGAFERIALLGGAEHPGRIAEIVEVGDLVYEAAGHAAHHTLLYDDGNVHGVRLIQRRAQD